MTVPKVRTVQRGGSRFYVDPVTQDRMPGVTSIINQLPKPFLRYWAAKEVAAYAVDHQAVIDGLDRTAAIELVKRAPDRDTRRSADIGTAAHARFEAIAAGEPLPTDWPGDVARDPEAQADVEAMVEHFRAFVAAWRPEILHSEVTVWSDTHGYAGTADAVAQIDGENVILDYKTTRSGVHSEVALQLTAYARADCILRPDGTRLPMPRIDAAAVVHVRPEGWQVVPVRIGDDVFEAFLALRRVLDWTNGGEATVLGIPLTA